MNRRKKTKGLLCPLKLGNGNIITDTDEIREAWKDYFHNLYTPVNDPIYENEFKMYVEELLKVMSELSYLSPENRLEEPITDEELISMVWSLKNNKAPGWDCITSEHVKYDGERLKKCLQCLFSLIVEYECIPTHFKLGIIVLIPKGVKCRTNQDNYIGITLL